MRPSPICTRDGWRPHTHERFDPFWSRVNEAGIVTIVHAGDSGYSSHGYAQDGFGASFSGAPRGPNVKTFHIERAAYDWLITAAFEKLFERFVAETADQNAA